MSDTCSFSAVNRRKHHVQRDGNLCNRSLAIISKLCRLWLFLVFHWSLRTSWVKVAGLSHLIGRSGHRGRLDVSAWNGRMNGKFHYLSVHLRVFLYLVIFFSRKQQSSLIPSVQAITSWQENI